MFTYLFHFFSEPLTFSKLPLQALTNTMRNVSFHSEKTRSQILDKLSSLFLKVQTEVNLQR
jgi:hypothetical protein